MKTINQILLVILLITSFAFAQGPQWMVYTTSNSGLPSNGISCLGVDSNNVVWIGTGIGGLAKFYNNVWTVYDTVNSDIPCNRIYDITFDKLNNLWIGTDSGAAKFNGVSWIVYNRNNSQLPTNIVVTIEVDEENVKWFGTVGGLAKFDDTNWTIYNDSNSGLAFNVVEALRIEDDVKWIGYRTAIVDAGVSKFNDSSWIIFNTSNSGLPSNFITVIDIDNFGNKWFATHFGGLAKYNATLNLWGVFNSTNSGIGSNFINCIAIKNDIKYIGTGNAGLKVFNDLTWSTYNISNSPIPDNLVYDVTIDSLKNIWIGTPDGLAQFNSTGIVSIETNQNYIPDKFILYQNYPNPFNPHTFIEFKLLKNSNVKLEIYDVLGKLKSILFQGKHEIGNHKILFSSEGFSSGIYFYSLKVNNIIQTKSLIILK